MIQNLDAKDVACLPEPSGYILVLHARLEIAAGVVVGHDDGRCPLSDSFAEDLSGVDDGPVDQPHRADVDGEHLMGPVEADGEEVLLHPGGVVPDQGVDVRGGDDLPLLWRQAPPSKLKGSPDEGGLGGPESRYLEELCVADLCLAVEQLHQVPGDGGDTTPLGSASDEDGEELLVGEGFDSLGHHPLTRPVTDGHLLDLQIMWFVD